MRTEIYGDRITLRRYEKSFAPLLFEAASASRGGEFSRWMPWCHADYSLAESESFIEQVEENWQKETEFNFAIFDSKTGDFLGGVGLNQPNDQHKFYNLGYWIRISKQNQGTASAATRLLAKAAFEDLPINRLEILAAVENIPSQKAAEKAGALREGILRKRLIIGDRLHDGVMFSFIREDFEK
jgi:ribosomal-protein-serine acetyltransferase